MNKIILIALLAIAVWWLVKRMRVDDPSESKRPRESAPEKMVNCAHCGLYLPEKEAVRDDGKFYCCAQHRRPAG